MPPFLRVALLCAVVGAVPFRAAHPDSGDAFPVSLRDDRGVTIRLDAPPGRVVSLAPSLTEIVFRLGRGETLVGVTRFCDFPEQARALPRVGGIVDPDVERIVAARPDLVLCTTDGNPKGRVRALEEMGIPCFAAGPQDLEGIFRLVERVGRLLGVPGRGRREAERLRIRATRAAGPPEEGPSPRVLFVVSTRPVIAAGRETFLDELIRRAGGTNGASGYDGRYPRLSVEDLLAIRPDLVLLAAMAGAESFPPSVLRWKEIPAFRDHAVIPLPGDLVTRPGPRMVDALETVSRVLSDWRARRAGSPRPSRQGAVR